MDRWWDIGVAWLEILAGIAMLVAALFFLGMIAERETHINAHQATVQAQREYANFQRFHGNGIAYTEVVQAIWELSSTTLPVLVISEDRFNQVTHMNRGNGVSPQNIPQGVRGESSGFPILDPTQFNQVVGIPGVPFDAGNNVHLQSINPIILPIVHEHLDNWLGLAPNNQVLTQNGQGILLTMGATPDSRYVYARGTQSINPPTPNHQVMQTQVAQWLRDITHNFNGRVMRDSSGVPYMIIFLY